MVEKYIPLSVPNFGGNELKYVTNAVKSEWVSTNGRYVSEFEEKVAEYVSSKGAVSCQNGTSGLHLSLLVLGINQEDYIIVPTLTFIAAVNPIKYVGAKPIFMDCDDSLCLDPVKLEQFCQKECQIINGKLTYKKDKKIIKAIIVVHVFGNMSDMESIMKIAQKYNLKVVEDATEAIGTYYKDGKYKGKYAGTIGDLGVYSFNGNKIITSGGGGMIVSNEEKYLEHAKHLSTQAKTDELHYFHNEIGYNYRITNLQAALGLAQMEQLEDFIQIKVENFQYYKRKLKQILELQLIETRKGVRSNHWFYALLIKNKLNKDELIQYLLKNKIQCRAIWGLIHEQLPYKGEDTYEINLAKYYWEKVINIPCSTNLSKSEIDKVVNTIAKIYGYSPVDS